MPLHGWALLLCHGRRGWGLAIGGVPPTLCTQSLLTLHVHHVWLSMEQCLLMGVIMTQMSAYRSVFWQVTDQAVVAPVMAAWQAWQQTSSLG